MKNHYVIDLPCSCGQPLYFPILFSFYSEGVFRCLHCGAIEAMITGGNDGRDGTPAYTQTVRVALEADVEKWFAQLPVCLTDGENYIYLPSDLRAGSIAQLQEILPVYWREAGTISLRDRIIKAGIPKDCNISLPPQYARYKTLCQALQLKEDSPIETIAEYAMISHFNLHLLKDHILNRKDTEDFLCQWMQYQPVDLYWYSKNYGEVYFLAHDLLRLMPEVSPRLKMALVAEIEHLSMAKNPYFHDEIENQYRLASALAALVHLKINDETTLQMLRQKIAQMPNKDIKSIVELKNAIRQLSHV